MSDGDLSFSRISGDTLCIHISGHWTLGRKAPQFHDIQHEIESASVQKIAFDTQQLKGWDSGLLTFLINLIDFCTKHSISMDNEGLPQGLTRLLSLASAVPERKGARRESRRAPFLEKIADISINGWRTSLEMLEFFGEVTVAFMRLVMGKARFPKTDFLLIIQENSAKALPIVTLISLLVGMIFAFVASIQLKMFGAQIYVADIVGIAMVRVMSAIMTGIIMAGRTGAAFAAQLGTMQTNEEIDALQTLGISPMEFLVLRGCLHLCL